MQDSTVLGAEDLLVVLSEVCFRAVRGVCHSSVLVLQTFSFTLMVLSFVMFAGSWLILFVPEGVLAIARFDERLVPAGVCQQHQFSEKNPACRSSQG